ncbi:MAG: polysaccharide biosynthesis protein [Pirellulales bacterium]|nr:polysaccharide biosynthesis protein [Pirellulales bacterium]
MNTHLRQPFTKRVFLVLVLHALAFVAAYWLAFAARFDFALPRQQWIIFFVTLPALMFIKMVIFYALGHCHGSWRYVTFRDLAVLVCAAVLSSVVIFALNQFMIDNIRIPRSVMLIDLALTMMILGGLRSAWRLAEHELRPLMERKGFDGALILGANSRSAALAQQIQANPRLKRHIVGYLDDDPMRLGSRFGGIPVLGRPEEAPRLAAALGAKEVLIVGGDVSGKRLRELIRRYEQSNLALKVIPPVDDLLAADYGVQIRDVDIDDLLGRDAIQLNNDDIGALVEGRTVMVTGAGGSIGSEICRQVLRFRPKQLILLERGENALFLIDQELSRTTKIDLIPCVADIREQGRMREIFDRHRPEVVFHAAAFKHVPLMEHNPCEAIKNNVFGTKQLVELSDEFGVASFVMISTDKAVNPTSIMGVSKQLAERYVHAYAEHSQTKFVVVRFGNVLGSNGSVVPIFSEQIRRGGPVTVTHPEIERFFMTIPEASQLVLQAAAMGQTGQIFVLDMGDPVKIVDLARDLIRLSGLKPDEDIEIAFTGLRPGEKLYEELYFDNEEKLPTPHPKVFVAYHRPFTLDEVSQVFGELEQFVNGESAAMVAKLREIMPEYQPPAHSAPAAAAETPLPAGA